MGFGDFLKGAANVATLGIADDVADAAGNVGEAVVNTGKAIGKAASYTDDVLMAAPKAADVVWDNKGTIAGVAWDVAKDQLNPTKADFWINAGTLALGAATGGTGAAAITAARAARAAKTVDTAVDGVKAANAVNKSVQAVKAADKVGDAVSVGRRTKSLVQGAQDGGSIFGKATGVTDKIASSKTASFIGDAREAAGFSNRLGPVNRSKVALSNKVLGNADDAGFARTAVSRSLGGQKGIVPSARQGNAAQNATGITDDAWRANRLAGRGAGTNAKVQGGEAYVDAMSDPDAYLQSKAMEASNNPAVQDEVNRRMMEDRGTGGLPPLTQPPEDRTNISSFASIGPTSGAVGTAGAVGATSFQPPPGSSLSLSSGNAPGARPGYSGGREVRGYGGVQPMPTRSGAAGNGGNGAANYNVNDPYDRGPGQGQEPTPWANIMPRNGNRGAQR